MPDNTEWLNKGPGTGGEEAFAGLYAELKRIAAGRIACERAGGTLDATALVHEAWMRLEKSRPDQWRDRKQFYAAASEAMRRILVEAARRRIAAKRGGGKANVPLDGVEVAAALPDERLVGIHEALDRLEAEDELNARIVKLHFFAGLNFQEIGVLLHLNEKTIRRHWAVAKVWLYRALTE